MNTIFRISIFLLLLTFELLRVWLIMPMPGSQNMESIELAYFLGSNKILIRSILIMLLLYPVFSVFRAGSIKQKIIIGLAGTIYLGVFYLFNFQMEADRMFYQPSKIVLAGQQKNVIPANKLVIGIEDKGQARAYPIQLIGYHHQVVDTLNGQTILVTYCTVCRTGRIFSAVVNGKVESFRLVGMDHFNAMFEDATTKSWWRQATGEAIAGPRKGMRLQEIPSEQIRLSAWLEKYPGALILQPDSSFADNYRRMDVYDLGTGKSQLTRRDSASWKDKSWVVGIEYGTSARTYDWNLLVKQRIIQDSLPGLPLVIVMAKDTASFHTFSRFMDSRVLSLQLVDDQLVDQATGSSWDLKGEGINGPLKDRRLKSVQSYQEFLHSWEYFHPNSIRFQP